MCLFYGYCSLKIHLLIFNSSVPFIQCHSPWIHWKISGLKLYIWGLKTFDQNFSENMLWRSCFPSSGAMISFRSMTWFFPGAIPWRAWTRPCVNSYMYKHNGFYQNVHSKKRVENVINVPYHSDFELNHGTSCLPLSSVGKGSLTYSIEPGVSILSLVHIVLYASHIYKISLNFLWF